MNGHQQPGQKDRGDDATQSHYAQGLRWFTPDRQ